jgi:hypothetical protein
VAYDEKLAERIRDVLRDRSDITERRMMGGLLQAWIEGGLQLATAATSKRLSKRIR